MKTKTNQTKPDHCRIVIRDDINGTRTEVDSPQNAQEALDCHGLLGLANDWVMRHCDDDEPIALSVQIPHTNDLVIVHWHATGDLDVAKAAMRQALGEWRGQQ